MASPAEEFFNSLNAYDEINQLIENGEAEGSYLECNSSFALDRHNNKQFWANQILEC